MADQLISDAVASPKDEGLPNLTDGQDETFNSAGAVGRMSQAIQSDSYVASDSELAFSNHDGTNDTVDITAGIAYLDLSGETVDIQSGLGADNSTPGYDTTLPSGGMVMVVVPATVTGVALQDSTLSDVWLSYDTDGTGPGSAGSVYVRSDDTGSVTAPSHPSVKLGSANPDDASVDSLANRGASPSFDEPDIGDATADSLATGTQSLTTRHIRVWSDSEDMLTTIDPDSSSTPVQDALDAALVGGFGSIELPPGTVEDSGQIYCHNKVDIIANQSTIEITGSGNDGLVFDSSQTSSTSGGVIETNIYGTLTIAGRGDTANTGAAIREVSGWFDSTVDYLEIDGWNGPVWVKETGSDGYQCTFNYIKITNADAGDSDGLLKWEDGGSFNQVGIIAAYPTDSDSGLDSRILHSNPTSCIIGGMNIGGSAGRVIQADLPGHHGIHVRHINYEPDTQNSVPKLIFVQGHNPVKIGSVTLHSEPSIEDVYAQSGGANNYFGSVRRPLSPTISGNIVENRTDTNTPGSIIYEGKSSEVDNDGPSTLTEPIACLGDLTLIGT